MKNILLLLLAIPAFANAQFKNDNVLYKTVYWQEFCKKFPNEKDALLLDVRSQGEYDDTSEHSNLNIGHLKGSKHINISDLGNHLSDIKDYKDKPVYLYCSHSQRSRRSSKMLIDSGFTNVININGGLTALYLAKDAEVPCKANWLETHNTYKQLNPQQIYTLIKTTPGITIIDVRKDSAFKGISTVAKDKALGKLKGSVNIQLKDIAASLSMIPKTKPLLLIDDYGEDAGKTAIVLANEGYSNLSIGFKGLDAWLDLAGDQKKLRDEMIERNVPYEQLDGEVFNVLAGKNDATILDVRKAEEFQNQSKETWRNRGQIKGSVNIPLSELETKYPIISKEKPVIITAFGSGPEAYEAAALLSFKGWRNLYVLTNGIWGLRYHAFNYPGSMYLKDWVENVPEANL